MATRRKTYKLRGGDVYDVGGISRRKIWSKRKGTAKEKETDAGTDGGSQPSQPSEDMQTITDRIF